MNILTKSRLTQVPLHALEDGLGELEGDVLSGQVLVNGGESLSLVLDIGLLGLIEVDLKNQQCGKALTLSGTLTFFRATISFTTI